MKNIAIAITVCLLMLAGCTREEAQEGLAEVDSVLEQQGLSTTTPGHGEQDESTSNESTQVNGGNPGRPVLPPPDDRTFFELVAEPSVLLQFTPIEPGEELVVLHTNLGDITLRLFPDEAPLSVENFLTHARNGYYDGVIFHRVIEDFMIQGGDPDGTGTGGDNIWHERFFVRPMIFQVYADIMDEDELFQNFFGMPFDENILLERPSTGLMHFRGALAMAHAGGSMGSQFYIVQSSSPRPGTMRSIDSIIQALSQYGEVPQGFIQTMQEVGELYALHGGVPHLDWWWDFGLFHIVFGHVVEGMDVVDAIARVETVPAPEGAPPTNRPVEDVIIERISFVIYE